MMHRTLSKLPPEEIEAMGGLPDVPDSEKGPLRIAFEERMLEIWKKRQAGNFFLCICATKQSFSLGSVN